MLMISPCKFDFLPTKLFGNYNQIVLMVICTLASEQHSASTNFVLSGIMPSVFMLSVVLLNVV
jgi:hypothetical protein